jgi:glycosyltransferase involved in cell wall biosynthesis
VTDPAAQTLSPAARPQVVSVVIPSKDRWQLLLQTVQAILGQQRVEVRVIVVDDGSAEPYQETANQLPDPRVRIIRTTGIGISAARNVGLRACDTEWTAFCDHDDLWAPDKLTEQLTALQDSGADWCFCSAIHFDKNGTFVNAQTAAAGPDLYNRLLAGNCVGGASAMVVRTETLLQLGGFDETLRYCEDWDAWLRMAAVSGAVAVSRPLLAYRVHTASASYTDYTMAAITEFERRYAQERIDRSIGFDWGQQYFMAGVFASGREDRIRAFRSFWKASLRSRNWRWGLLAEAALVAPGFVYRRANREAAANVPPSWAAEVEDWLYPMLGIAAGD